MPSIDSFVGHTCQLRRLSTAFMLITLLAVAQGAKANTDAASGHADQQPPELSLDNVRSGTLLMRSPNAPGGIPMPSVDSRIHVNVTGPLARTQVVQRFENPTQEWVEAVYAFPLPPDAAVDTLRLHIGKRVIEGEIQEREAAHATYEMAKTAGKRTALVEQKRPNLFATSVANIPPGADIKVEIRYQHQLRWDDARFELRIPLAVTPRYGKPESVELQLENQAHEASSNSGWLMLPSSLENVVRPARPTNAPQVTLQVNLRPGFPITRLTSHHHDVRRESFEGGRGVQLNLAPDTLPDRDFVLSWEPASGHAPQAAMFTEQHEGDTYAMLMFAPPSSEQASEIRLDREVVFVLDISGSMSGQPIRAAKQALKQALDRLSPRESFAVIAFASEARRYATNPQRATAGNVQAAKRWVDNLDAHGGTNMLSGLKKALASPSSNRQSLRQVVFITDGAITDHESIFEILDQRLDRTRLFTVGIGHAPNAHLMTEMAHFGRGSFTFIAQSSEVGTKMEALFKKLETPALTDLELSLAETADIAPDPLPDLYAGEPLVAYLKLDGAPHRVEIEGKREGQPWRVGLAVPEPTMRSGIGKAWARAKIRHWERAQARGLNRGQVRDAILKLALDHDLVTRFTSLVAVDKTPARDREALLKKHAVDGVLPHGMEQTRIGMAQTATPAALLFLISALLLVLSLLLWLVARWRN